ncbi:MAG TPA: cytochrome c oxidase subunit 4, partial [Actinomycetota bacterium]
FALTSMLIAIPTGIKIFNWLSTMWGGSLRFRTAFCFAASFVGMFTIGGLSGIMHASPPVDLQQTDTYFVVAHFHYVIFGGAVFGIFAGLFYWWPKIFGRALGEAWAKLQFWLMIIGFNLAFGPMHILGLQGMIRREYTYPESLGLTFWNQVSTVGAFLIALSVAMFMINVVRTHLKPRGEVVEDPWDARTLEWMTSSPPPVHNFDEIPTVHALDEFWHRKYVEDERTGRLVPAQAGASDEPHADHEGGHGSIHLPSPSYWPLVAGLGLPIMAYGVLYSWWLIGAGALVALVGFYGWALEPSVAEE